MCLTRQKTLGQEPALEHQLCPQDVVGLVEVPQGTPHRLLLLPDMDIIDPLPEGKRFMIL